MSTFEEIINSTVKSNFKKVLLKQDWTQLNKNFDFENWNKLYLPRKKWIFRAFNYFHIENTKVCILGQDPYPSPDDACGLAFVPKNKKNVPASLKNIYKEIRNSCDISEPNIRRWPRHGILLLNSILTTNIGERKGHSNCGWGKITKNIIKELPEKTIFLAWGKNAQKLTENCKNRICTSHPSPLSATKGKNPFIGSNCFKKISYNIDW